MSAKVAHKLLAVEQVHLHFPGFCDTHTRMATFVRPGGISGVRSYHLSDASALRVLRVFNGWTPRVRVGDVAGSIVFEKRAAPTRKK